MEKPKSNQKPIPGLAEALHPEIGNGSAFENDKHAFILRLPDASIQLAEYLILSPTEADDRLRDQNTKEETTHLEASEKEVSGSPQSSRPGSTQMSGEQELTTETKNGKKKKRSKEGKKPGAETPEDISKLQDESLNKAGKLLRKAAKAIKKKEAAEETPPLEEPGRTPAQLSPFTSWLKNLAGSDYVHPYEDDFAFEQASGSVKAGMSETFADLLAAQGYKDQAREMYLKLMEKYPEKSAFFAAKIEAL